MKTKYYSMHRTAVDKDGCSHIVTLVARLQQRYYWGYQDAESNILDNGGHPVIIRTPKKLLERVVTMGVSVCHPDDEFDEKVGFGIARNRIKDGKTIGTVRTNDATMLTSDSIEALMDVKSRHICDNIDRYLEFFAKY